MKSFIFCLLLPSLLYDAQCQMYGGSWMNQLFDNINRMNGNIRQNVMSMNKRIQDDVDHQISQVTSNVQHTIAQGQAINTGLSGDSVVVNSGPGSSRSIVSGYDANGELYHRQSEDTVVGGILHHTDRIHNPSLGTTREFHYTLDLTDPTAKPVLQEN